MAAELRPEHRRRVGGVGGGARPYRRQGELRLAPWGAAARAGARPLLAATEESRWIVDLWCGAGLVTPGGAGVGVGRR